MVIFKLANDLHVQANVYTSPHTSKHTYPVQTLLCVKMGKPFSHGLRPKEALINFVKLLMPQELLLLKCFFFLKGELLYYLYVII